MRSLFPSSFTPNADGKNDLFGPAGNSFYGVTNYHFDIYNRYGLPAFHSTDPFKKWDGRYKGKVPGNTSFVWVVSCEINGRAFYEKGTVTLIR